MADNQNQPKQSEITYTEFKIMCQNNAVLGGLHKAEKAAMAVLSKAERSHYLIKGRYERGSVSEDAMDRAAHRVDQASYTLADARASVDAYFEQLREEGNK